MRLVHHVAAIHRRTLVVLLAILGPRVAYTVSAAAARLLYRLLDPLRLRSEAQCRAALAGRLSPEEVPRIAERAFVHRVWSVMDLMLAGRLLHPGTYHAYGGRMPLRSVVRLREAQQRRQPIILLTAYYGPFDLLPVFLGYNGIRAGVVYRTHVDAGFDAFRRRVRARSGCELIPLERAAGRVAEILESGGTVALLADHHAEGRGVPAIFLGLPTKAVRTVGLLARQYDADMAVACIRRTREPFRFEIIVADVIPHEEWATCEDPVAWITERYLRGLERIILADPEQYLWAHPRWGLELARELVERTGADRKPARV